MAYRRVQDVKTWGPERLSQASQEGMAAYRAAREAEGGDPLTAASSHEEAAKKWDAVVPLAEEAADNDANSPHFSAGRLVARYKDQAADAKYRANWHRKQAQVMREIHGLNQGSIAAKDLSTYSHPGTQKSEPRAAILARGILAAVELRKAVETGGKTMADIIAMDYTTYPGGFAIHPKDTGYGYASGRKLKYPAFKWSDGKYVPAQAGEAEKFLSAHNAATVENDRAGWGIRSS